MEEAAAGKARLLAVKSLTDGTMRQLVAAERRVCRTGTSATRVSGPMYRGALYVKNSVTQHGDLVLYALRYPQPTKADERIGDVIGALQVENQSAQEVGWDADQLRRFGFVSTATGKTPRKLLANRKFVDKT